MASVTEIQKLRAKLTINQCQLTDVRDARRNGHGREDLLRAEHRLLIEERDRLLSRLYELGGTWP